MKPYPHRYSVQAVASSSGSVELRSPGVADLFSAPPVEFDGPGDQWSPESLLVASVIDCFVLTFRAIARASKLDWTRLECSAEGTLDRVDRVTRFVSLRIVANLALPRGDRADAAERLLQKAEDTWVSHSRRSVHFRIVNPVAAMMIATATALVASPLPVMKGSRKARTKQNRVRCINKPMTTPKSRKPPRIGYSLLS